MKIGVWLIAGLFAVIGAGALPAAQNRDDKGHQEWIEARYKEAVSIQPGMTRAELKKLFTEEGGMQMVQTRTYVLKSCYLIHLEVKFDAPSGAASGREDDVKIVEVSKPYLARIVLD